MAVLAGLTPRNSFCDHHIAQHAGIRDSGFGIRRKAQHVRCVVLAAKRTVERAHPDVGDERDRHLATGRGGGDAPQPGGKSRRAQRASAAIRQRDGQQRHHALPVYFSYALTICCTSLWRTTSRSSKYTNAIPSISCTTFIASTSPDMRPVGRSICVTSPVITALLPNPRRVRNIFICS